jgi:hypothetical protein
MCRVWRCNAGVPGEPIEAALAESIDRHRRTACFAYRRVMITLGCWRLGILLL